MSRTFVLHHYPVWTMPTRAHAEQFAEQVIGKFQVEDGKTYKIVETFVVGKERGHVVAIGNDMEF